MRRSDLERRLRDELHSARPPRAAEAERRGWHVVRAAHATRVPARRRHPGRRLALALAAAALLAVLALSPAGAKVGDWLGEVVDPAPEATRSTLGSLPAPGRLLVVSDAGPWIVQGDGARRRLGDFRDAGWSPGGLFVVAARGRELVALEPDGDQRWVRPARRRVSVPRWSPDGNRIAYRSGRELHVVYGDNAKRWRLAGDVGRAAPAWRPGRPTPGQVVAFWSRRRVRIVEVDTRRVVGVSPRGPAPRELWWTVDGRRLVAVARDGIRVYGARGRPLGARALPGRLRAGGSALDPAGRRLAVAATRPDGRSSELLLYRLDRDAPPRQLFAGTGVIDGLTWSLDGRVVVVGLPEADQWLFLWPRERGRLRAVARIRRQFGATGAPSGAGAFPPAAGGFPRPAGWCYAEPRDELPFPPCSSGAGPAP